VGPLILREGDGRVESRGIRVDLGLARVRLQGHGEAPSDAQGLVVVDALSGAVLMLTAAALRRVGPLDEEYFFSFEDVDWCLRARAAGFRLGVVSAARAWHAGAASIGRASPDRLYYAARNHVRLLQKLEAAVGDRPWVARAGAAGFHLAHALVQGDSPRRAALGAVLAGLRDARQGRFGPRGTPGSRALERPGTIPPGRA
jgi:hypothetical protein